MDTVERQAWQLLDALVASLEEGPRGGPREFLAVPLVRGGGLMGRPGGGPVRVADLALITVLVDRGYLEVARTPHGLPLLTITPAGLAADRAHHQSHGLLPVS